jgi:hypothetical protein
MLVLRPAVRLAPLSAEPPVPFSSGCGSGRRLTFAGGNRLDSDRVVRAHERECRLMVEVAALAAHVLLPLLLGGHLHRRAAGSFGYHYYRTAHAREE